MTLDDLQSAWRRLAPRDGAAPAPDRLARLRREADAATRRFRGMIVLAMLLFVLGWVSSVGAHVAGLKPLTGLQVATQIIGSVFYLAWGAIAVRSKRAVGRERERMGQTMRDALAASLRTVRLQIQNYRLAGVTLPLAIAATAALSYAKVRAGELPAIGAFVSTCAVGIIALIAGLAMARRYMRDLRPRSKALESELQELETGEAPSGDR